MRLFGVVTIFGHVAGQFPSTISLSYKSTMCMDLWAMDTSPGNAVNLWQCDGLENQVWLFDENDGHLRYAADPNMCADVGGLQEGNQMFIWECNDEPQQKWGYDKDVHSFYLIESGKNSDASLCLDILGGGTTDGTPIIVAGCTSLWRQLWSISAGAPIAVSGKNFCLDNADDKAENGNPVQIMPCTGAASQKWIWSQDDFLIKYGGNPDYCIDSGAMYWGEELILWECNGYDQQLWGYDSSMGTLFLLNSGSERDATICLDLPGGQAYPRVHMEIWGCNGCWNQNFVVSGVSVSANRNSSNTREARLESGDDPCPPQPAF